MDTSTFATMKEKLLKRFEEEVGTLERELKMELPKEIQRARELGDLRENAEYQAAKERQTYVQARIAMLKRRMNEIALMNMERIPHGKAGFGSTVRLREHNAGEMVFQLVMPEDADAEKGSSPPRHRSAAPSSTRKKATTSSSRRPPAPAASKSSS